MEDRFKFRVWDDDNECFDYLDFNDLEKVKHTIDSYNEYFWSGYFKENPQYLMQCTGIKDKNGKLIYEGDIVERENVQGKKRGVVSFNQALLHFEVPNMSLFSLTHRAEVIGNIYENPDLI